MQSVRVVGGAVLMRGVCSSANAAFVAAVLGFSAFVHADEWRGMWVDGWSSGFLSQAQVDKLLGVPGNASSKGDLRNGNCNAVFAEVRRRADVAYPSGLSEPYMSGL